MSDITSLKRHNTQQKISLLRHFLRFQYQNSMHDISREHTSNAADMGIMSPAFSRLMDSLGVKFLHSYHCTFYFLHQEQCSIYGKK